MSPEVAVRVRLLQISAVTALVGARIYQLKLPQKPTLPAIRLQLIDDPEEYHLRGGSVKGRARVQVDAYSSEATAADPYGEVTSVANAINGDDAGSGLSGWVGDLGGPPPVIRITGMLRVDRQTGYEADELRLVSMRQDYFVWYRT